ncbi:hypothetical protein ACVR2T_004410 [Cronobacter malonaticus]
MHSENNELVKAGHELAKCLDNEPLIDIAKMIVRLADKLEVTTLAMREKTKQCEQIAQAVGWVEGGNFTLAEAVAGHVSGLKAATQRSEELAAENAALKAGVKYFSYSEMAGFEEHSTADLAQKSADADLAGERDEASSEGWSEETDTICWGVILQKAVENKFEKPSEENGWIGWSDYALLPNIETPATDAFLREVRAQGVEMFAEKCASKSKQAISSDTRDSWWLCGEHASDFAAQLRQGGAA